MIKLTSRMFSFRNNCALPQPTTVKKSRSVKSSSQASSRQSSRPTSARSGTSSKGMTNAITFQSLETSQEKKTEANIADIDQTDPIGAL